MNTQEQPSQYLLLLRGTHWESKLSPDELQEVMARWYGWYEKGQQSGKLVGAQPLQPAGKVVSGKNGKSVADGPFAESKEAIAGYFLLQVDTIEEALAVAQANPLLEQGMTIEVRPVIAQCPAMQKVSELLAQANA